MCAATGVARLARPIASTAIAQVRAERCIGISLIRVDAADRPPRKPVRPEARPCRLMCLPPETGSDDGEAREWGRGSTGEAAPDDRRSEEHTSELQSHHDLVCRLLLE